MRWDPAQQGLIQADKRETPRDTREHPLADDGLEETEAICQYAGEQRPNHKGAVAPQARDPIEEDRQLGWVTSATVARSVG
jgi:hypothetical protein